MRQEVKKGVANPRDFKVGLALEIVERFHSKAAAENALEEFERRKTGAAPTDIKTITLHIDGDIPIANLLKQAGLVASTSEALRLIREGAVKIDSVKVEDKNLKLKAGTTHIYQVGKRRFAKVAILQKTKN